jgi:glycerol-3-phosphate dehydrogenase
VSASEDEISYLIAAVNRYFKEKLRREDVLEAFSGVRPLFDDGAGNPSAVTRDYVFDLDETGGAPLLNIFGGKITTFRKLSEHAMEKMAHLFPEMGENWTSVSPLPGGDIPDADFTSFVEILRGSYPWMPRDLILHYARLYGTRTAMIIGKATSLPDLGQHFGAHLYEAEVRYLIQHEWAMHSDDVLIRRTKHGLHLSADEKVEFTNWFDTTVANQQVSAA